MPRPSCSLSIASAAYLGVMGFAMLLASSEVLSFAISASPFDAAWIGQLIAGPWLGVAILNWNGRANRMGGIYGRPQVMLNFVLYLVGALGLAKSGPLGLLFWVLTLPMGLFSIAYGVTLMRGPFDPHPIPRREG